MLLSHLKSWLLELIGVAVSSFTYFKNPFGVEDTLLIQPSLPLLSLQSGQWRYQYTDVSMSTPKQKRQKVSLETKKAIIEASKAKNYAELAEEFSIPKTTIATIVQKKDAIHRAIDSGRQAKRARITKGKHEQMEEALLVWFKQVRNQNVSVSGDLLKMDFHHIRHIMLFLFDEGISRVDSAKRIYDVYGADTIKDSACQKWFTRFRRGTEADSIGDCSSKWMAGYQDYPLDKESRDKEIGSGWNKHVYQVERGTVIKKLNGKGVSLVGCDQDSKCIENVAKGFIKEIGFIMKLQGNPSVPQIFAYCIPHDFSYNFHQLSIVVSAGFTPLDVICLLQSDWTRRLQITSQILDFVNRIWPVKLHDFRRQQFVLSSQKIPVYVDFDDTSEAQKHVFAGDENCHYSVNQDIEYSRKIASRTYEDFSKDFFWIGAPKEASKCLAKLKHFYTNGTLDVPKFQKIVKRLLEL